MQIQIPHPAAVILDRETGLRENYPEVWLRYLNNHIIRAGVKFGVRVYTSVGRCDLIVIRRHFEEWLEKCPNDPRRGMVTTAVYALTGAIAKKQAPTSVL